MTKIRVTKIFEFDTAHALHNYDGLCSNIHGHTYKLHVTVIGEPISDPSSPKYGMVVDFGVLKNKIKENLVDKFDHSLIVSRDESGNFTNGSPIFRRIHVVDFQPTAENIVAHFAELKYCCTFRRTDKAAATRWCGTFQPATLRDIHVVCRMVCLRQLLIRTIVSYQST